MWQHAVERNEKFYIRCEIQRSLLRFYPPPHSPSQSIHTISFINIKPRRAGLITQIVRSSHAAWIQHGRKVNSFLRRQECVLASGVNWFQLCQNRGQRSLQVNECMGCTNEKVTHQKDSVPKKFSSVQTQISVTFKWLEMIICLFFFFFEPAYPVCGHVTASSLLSYREHIWFNIIFKRPSSNWLCPSYSWTQKLMMVLWRLSIP